jgi:hypothetical protein
MIGLDATVAFQPLRRGSSAPDSGFDPEIGRFDLTL